MAMLDGNVGVIFTMMVLIFSALAVAGRGGGGVVEIQNGLSAGTTLTVHCKKDGRDMGTLAINHSRNGLSFSLPASFHGTYICEFAAAGKRTTIFDVVNSRCDCATYWGCTWVARGEGFYCKHELVYRWAH